jgi:heme/copper-type cytochrome/quinol oxidase subunit 2
MQRTELLKEPSLGRRKRRGTMVAPSAKKGSRMSGMQVVAVVIVIIVALSGAYYYFEVYSKPSSTGYFSERVRIDIGGYYYNASDPVDSTPAAYYPSSFNVTVGAHITLSVTNTDNMTHGVAVPAFHVDTGPMAPNATTTITFVASPTGNYTYDEPSSDCGGGSCDSNQSLAALTGWFLVVS